jgi:hypothetical protein
MHGHGHGKTGKRDRPPKGSCHRPEALLAPGLLASFAMVVSGAQFIGNLGRSSFPGGTYDVRHTRVFAHDYHVCGDTRAAAEIGVLSHAAH